MGASSSKQGGCCGSGAKTIDDAELRPSKPAQPAPAAGAKTQQQPTAAAVAGGKPSQQQVPNSQQIDGLPESVPVVLPPPDKPDAIAGVPLQPSEYQSAVGQPPLPNGAATVPSTVGLGTPPSPFFSPFADNRKARAGSSENDRGSNGSVTRFAGNGNTAAADGGGSMAGVSPFNSAASRQSSGGFSGGLKSSSFATFGSGALGDQPAMSAKHSASDSMYDLPNVMKPLMASAASSRRQSTSDSVAAPPPPQRLKTKAQAAEEYSGAQIPHNEDARYGQLCALNVLNTEADPRFDDITNLVCSIFKAPIAIVSLVEKERQWFKSIVGLSVSETSRASSFCAWTLLPVNPEVLVVEDATEDPRFRDNPLVIGGPGIRFYAGAPLVTSEGYRLGSLCCIDTKPRKFDAESANLLCNFAEMVVREIEKEKARMNESMMLNQQTSSLMRAIDAFNEAIMLVDTGETSWNIMFINDAWLRMMGRKREEAANRDLFGIFRQPDKSREQTMAACQGTIQKRVEFKLDFIFSDPWSTKGTQRITANFRPAATEALNSQMPLIGIPGFVPWQNKMPNYYFATITLHRQTSLDRMIDDAMMTPGSSGRGTPSSAGSRWRPHVVGGRKEPFDGVALGPLLGKGSFGRVYRALWDGKPVAVKIIEATATTEDAKPAFEAEFSPDLTHPNVVQTFKASSVPITSEGKQFEETWLLLEFCDKGSLQDVMDRGAFRSVRIGIEGSEANLVAINNTAREIASGMAYLHNMDILHGDLTAGNILLSSADAADARGFNAKVADFGLSRVMVQTSISTGTYGTVTHMPPELLTTGRLSKAADTYSFGVLLWEMYTGQRPWAGMLQMQIIFNVTVQKKQLEFPSDAPEQIKSLARRCMSTEPDERPTFPEILAELGPTEDDPILPDEAADGATDDAANGAAA